MKHIKLFLLFLLLFSLSPAHAETVVSGNVAEQLYEAGQYNDALCAYQALVKNGESPQVYYNMGNCYYRLDSIAQAVLWYERALLLDPSDEEIRYNLDLARSKTVDKIASSDEAFYQRWWNAFTSLFSVTGWTVAGIVCFALALVGLCMFFFMHDVAFRKLGFYGAIFLFLGVLLTNVLAWRQYNARQSHDRAVIMAEYVSCKSSPNEAGKELFQLHEGTTVRVLDDSMNKWLHVSLSDGKQCWLPSASVERI